jgi:heptosyltransferase-2
MNQGGTLIILPSPGIGDLMWRLPHIRAIARQEGAITLLTRSRTKAAEWLIHDPNIKNVIYAEPKELGRAFWEVLRGKFSKSWMLHKSFSYALVPFLARIPERVGLGFDNQASLLTTKNILSPLMKKQHLIHQLDALVHLHGLSFTPSDRHPTLMKGTQQVIQAQFSSFTRPWICLGIGGSEPYKKWPLEHFIELGAKISTHHPGTLFLCGGPAEAAEALQIQKGLQHKGGKAETVTHLTIEQAFAFISEINLYIGNDTSLFNIAASFEIPTLGLFGATPPLTYSPSIYALQCPNKELQGPEAMKEIKPALVYNTLQQQKWLEA